MKKNCESSWLFTRIMTSSRSKANDSNADFFTTEIQVESKGSPHSTDVITGHVLLCGYAYIRFILQIILTPSSIFRCRCLQVCDMSGHSEPSHNVCPQLVPHTWRCNWLASDWATFNLRARADMRYK